MSEGVGVGYDETMRVRLQALIDHPDSFTPSYRDRYRFLIEHCDGIDAHATYAITQLLGRDASRGFTELPAEPDLRFPAEHAPDLGYQMGWHFIVGTARATDGTEYGVQFMPFTSAVLPADVRNAFGLSEIENQVMETHLAISRRDDRHYRGAPVVVDGRSGEIEVRASPFLYRAGETVMESSDPTGELIPLHIRGRAWDRSGPDPIELKVDFTFTHAKPPFLQGNDGAAPSLAGVGTLYYSIPYMTLGGERNTLRIGADEIEIESGEFWMDHQWGTGLVTCNIFAGNPRSAALRAATLLAPPSPGGWDWFMAMFDGDHQLTLATLHSTDDPAHYDQSGPTAPTPMTIPVFGARVDPAGVRHRVTGSLLVDDWVRAERSPHPDVYPVTGVWYPDRWTFTLDGDVPDVMRTFTMTPIVEGGQAGFFAPGVQYSEGAVILTDVDGNGIGHGFAESVGYHLSFAPSVMSVAGLPVTPESVALFDRSKPSPKLRIQAMLHLLRPSARRELRRWSEALTLKP
ncbi:MAG: lipocalin-like domain-containing protein [Actinomycetes bacterium]